MGRLLILNLAAGLLGAYLASHKGRNTLGWGLVCFLLPVAVVVVAFLPTVPRPGLFTRCPGCGRPMPAGAGVCEHCGTSRPIDMVQCPHCHTVVPAGPVCAQCNRSLKG